MKLKLKYKNKYKINKILTLLTIFKKYLLKD